MNLNQPVKTTSAPRILVAPLDWGLGHATRCIPVIYELLKQGAAVSVAGEGAQVDLLKKEFPELVFLPLNGYRVRYAKSRTGLLWSLMLQVPSIISSIKYENKWLKKMMAEHRFHAVVSDNRYGLYHPATRSIFITHQLRIKSPFGNSLERALQNINYKYIGRFNECWIPDNENENNLAGELSHPALLPSIPIYYTGALSRLKNNAAGFRKNHLFISLSGPEPQRSILENKVVADVSHYAGTAAVLRGLPGNNRYIPSTNDILFYNHLPTPEYNTEIEKAEYVICRSGYSTIMDIARLGKKSILIPTPGQPEQQYLAEYLEHRKFAVCVNQKTFSLSEALMRARQFQYDLPATPENNLPALVTSLLQKIKSA